jgi:hypothetical protein
MVKKFLSIIMIAIFFVVTFIPRAKVGVLNYWLLFGALFVFAGLYIYLRFYVSKNKCAKLLKSDDFYSISVALVPEKADGEFIHGRLVAYNSMLLLYGVGKKTAELKWSEELSNLESLSFQKLTTGRTGFVLSVENRGDFQFVCRIKNDKKSELISSLGLEVDD